MRYVFNPFTGNLDAAPAGGGTGTVTSVNISSSDSSLTTGGGPITSAGTLTATLNMAHANTWSALQSFTTSSLGVATATTLNKITITTPPTGSTLTLCDASTLTVAASKSVNLNASLTLGGSDGSSICFPTSGTVALLGVCNIFSAFVNTFCLNISVCGCIESAVCSLGTSQDYSKGICLINPTPATLNNQQISPAVHWRGCGWKTNATSASQCVDFSMYVLPVQGSANPSGQLLFRSSINNAGYATKMFLDSAGNLNLPALTGNRMVCTDGSSNLVSFDLFNTANAWTQLQTFSAGISVADNTLCNNLIPTTDLTQCIGCPNNRWTAIYAGCFYGSGANLTGVSAGAAGSDCYVQYAKGGVLCGCSCFIFCDGTNTMTSAYIFGNGGSGDVILSNCNITANNQVKGATLCATATSNNAVYSACGIEAVNYFIAQGQTGATGTISILGLTQIQVAGGIIYSWS